MNTHEFEREKNYKQNIEDIRKYFQMQEIRKYFQREENIFNRKMIFQKLNVGNVKNLDTTLCKSKVLEFQLEEDFKTKISTIKSLNMNDDLKDQISLAILRHNENSNNSDDFLSSSKEELNKVSSFFLSRLPKVFAERVRNRINSQRGNNNINFDSTTYVELISVCTTEKVTICNDLNLKQHLRNNELVLVLSYENFAIQIQN